MVQVNAPVQSLQELGGARQVEEAEGAQERAAAEANKAASKAAAVEAAEADAVVAGEEEQRSCVRLEQCVLVRERTCEDNTVRSNKALAHWSLWAKASHLEIHFCTIRDRCRFLRILCK